MAGEVGEDVAEEVGGDDQVEGFGLFHQLQRGEVCQAFVDFGGPSLPFQHFTAGVAEQATGHWQDVGLVNQGDPPGLACLGHFQRAASQGITGIATDHPLGDGDAFGLPVLAAAIEAFAVLAQDHQIHSRPVRDAGPTAHRAQIDVELEGLAQLQDGAAIAGYSLAGGRGDCAEDARPAVAQDLEGGFGHSAAGALEAVPTRLGFHRFQLGQEFLQGLDRHRHHFTADTVPWDDD
ncbi:hypothetical protein D9M71_141770 [compost metagenome]